MAVPTSRKPVHTTTRFAILALLCAGWLGACASPAPGPGAAALDAAAADVAAADVPQAVALADALAVDSAAADATADATAAGQDATPGVDAPPVAADAQSSETVGAATCKGDGACDDGDPCTQADFCVIGQCKGYPIAGCCTKKCTNKACGPDGCGGSCGGCAAGQLCTGAYTCAAAGKVGDTCADAAVIPSLPFQSTGNTAAMKDDYSAEALACGPFSLGDGGADVVYRYTPTADGVLQLSLTGIDFPATFYVVSDCADIKGTCSGGVVPYPSVTETSAIWFDVKAGKAVFIVVDGDNQNGTFTLNASSCTPDCKNKTCGSDGCGKNCGECPMTPEWNCSDQQSCVCTPSCKDKQCGSDGCTGACGSCAADQVCDAKGGCVAAGKAGDTCSTAIPMGSFPFQYSGTTKGLGDDQYAWWACEGNGTGGYLGDGGPDVVFALSPAKTTTYFAALKSSGGIPAFYALSDCANKVACLQAGYKGYQLKDWLFIEAPAGKTTYVLVDGNQGLDFELSVSDCPTASTCANGEPGEYCSVAMPVGALPFTASGSVGSALDSYKLEAGGSCKVAKTIGAGGHDVAYSLTASSAGTYHLEVQGKNGMDPALVVTSDCTQMATACLGYAAKSAENGKEVLDVTLKAAQTVYVVVENETTTGGDFTLTVTKP